MLVYADAVNILTQRSFHVSVHHEGLPRDHTEIF